MPGIQPYDLESTQDTNELGDCTFTIKEQQWLSQLAISGLR